MQNRRQLRLTRNPHPLRSPSPDLVHRSMILQTTPPLQDVRDFLEWKNDLEQNIEEQQGTQHIPRFSLSPRPSPHKTTPTPPSTQPKATAFLKPPQPLTPPKPPLSPSSNKQYFHQGNLNNVSNVPITNNMPHKCNEQYQLQRQLQRINTLNLQLTKENQLLKHNDRNVNEITSSKKYSNINNENVYVLQRRICQFESLYTSIQTQKQQLRVKYLASQQQNTHLRDQLYRMGQSFDNNLRDIELNLSQEKTKANYFSERYKTTIRQPIERAVSLLSEQEGLQCVPHARDCRELFKEIQQSLEGYYKGMLQQKLACHEGKQIRLERELSVAQMQIKYLTEENEKLKQLINRSEEWNPAEWQIDAVHQRCVEQDCKMEGMYQVIKESKKVLEGIIREGK